MQEEKIEEQPKKDIKSEIEITKGYNDIRTYHYETLKNNLRLLIVSDPEAENTACSLRVDIGSFSEPQSFPGLAHFLEHLLFLGSKKYPDHQDYNEFFGENGGYNNAWTEDHFTTYNFDIAVNSKFSEALDRTVSFFINPTFDPLYVEKELNAVDSEFKEDYSDDEWRFWAVFNDLACDSSPFKRFTLGNRETLEKEGVRDELIKFWVENYSANLMTVIVYGSYTVEEFRDMSIPILEEIEDKNKERSDFGDKGDHYGIEERGKYVQLKSIKDEYLVKFIWFIPPCNTDSRNNSNAFYLKYLLENEHKGSIHDILHQQNLIISLNCQIHNQATSFSLLSFEIHLSEIGKNELSTVLKVVGAYVHMVREIGPLEWFYKELVGISKIEFDYEPRIDEYQFVVNLTEAIDNFDKRDILKRGIYSEYDEKNLERFVKENLKFENMMIMHEGNDLEFEANKHEKYFKVDYRVEPFSPEFLKNLNSEKFLKKVKIPKPNTLIPEDFSLHPEINTTKEPIFSLNEEALTVFLRESQFKNPKCNVTLNAFYDAEKYSINKLESFAYSKIFENYLDSTISDVIDEGLQVSLTFKIKFNENSLKINIDCFNDSLLRFLNLLDEKIESITPFDDENQFLVSYNEYKASVDNQYKNEPSEIVNSYSLELLYYRGFDIRDTVKVAENLNFDGFRNWVSEFYENLFFDVLYVGNLNLELCQKSTKIFKKIFKRFGDFSPLKISEIRNQDIIELKQGEIDVFRVKIPCKSYKTSCLLLTVQVSPENEKSNELSTLVTDIIKDNFYNKLRTEEQLGYSCSVNFTNTRGYLNLEFEIEGGNHNPNYYSERIFQFFEDELNFIKNLENENFEKFKTACKKLSGRLPYSIKTSGSHYYNRIHRKGNFSSIEKDTEELVKKIDSISKEELIKFYEENLINKEKRRVLEIYAVCDAGWTEFLEKLRERVDKGEVKEYESLEEFKDGKSVLEDKYSVGKLVQNLKGISSSL